MTNDKSTNSFEWRLKIRLFSGINLEEVQMEVKAYSSFYLKWSKFEQTKF